MSCSSQQIEFQSLLKESAQQTHFELNVTKNLPHLKVSSETGAEIIIAQHGYPINFTKEPNSDPVRDMTLTRLLLAGGFIQAASVEQPWVKDGITPNKSNNICMLNPFIQQWVVENWQNLQPPIEQNIEEIEHFKDIAWIKKNSSGEICHNRFLEKSFRKIPENTNEDEASFHHSFKF